MSAPTPSLDATSVAIVGGGLAGLTAAWLLNREGQHTWQLLEARPRLGGRILSPPAHPDSPAPHDRVDLGPTWYWPDFQPELHRLVQALGLPTFAQHEAGDMLVERHPHGAPARVPGYAAQPTPHRLVGGMSALTDAIARQLNAARCATGQGVVRLERIDGSVLLTSRDPAGHTRQWGAERVLLAVPPRLTVAHIEFDPPLPPSLARAWQATPTWMAPHAKYVAVYPTPFWRTQGLSGEARSACGPMAEIHDASMPDGSAALFGFVGVPVHGRQALSAAELCVACRHQLARLFGPEAAHVQAEHLQDWALDAHTATPADAHGSGDHPHAPPPTPDAGPWAGCLVGAASEWSTSFAGYVAGAVDAATQAVRALSTHSTHPGSP